MLPLVLSLLLLAQAPVFRAEVRMVQVDVEVSVNGRPVDGLTAADFRIKDEGNVQPIAQFGYTEEPLDLVLVFDTSGSMGPAVRRIAEVARVALGALRPDDRVAVVAFAAETELILPFTTDRAAVDRVIRTDVLRRTFLASSRIQQAVADTAQQLVSMGPVRRRRAVLVITDNIGSGRDGRMLPLAWQANAVVSGLIVRSEAAQRLRLLSPPAWFGVGGIGGVAEKTGGEMIDAGDRTADEFRTLVDRLRRRYLLYYAMPKGRPGEEREIEVELSDDAARGHAGARVRARTGYIVPG
jgi:VWFA-related protein